MARNEATCVSCENAAGSGFGVALDHGRPAPHKRYRLNFSRIEGETGTSGVSAPSKSHDAPLAVPVNPIDHVAGLTRNGDEGKARRGRARDPMPSRRFDRIPTCSGWAGGDRIVAVRRCAANRSRTLRPLHFSFAMRATDGGIQNTSSINRFTESWMRLAKFTRAMRPGHGWANQPAAGEQTHA